jgi:hypothetical protein
MDHLKKAFRELRKAWFVKQLRSNAPEREWEEEDERDYREKRNSIRKAIFDEQTEGIIQGGDFRIAPLCEADMK